MAGNEVRLRMAGIRALTTSAAAEAIVRAHGERMAAAAGPDFEFVSRPHPRTARGYVQPKNARGMRAEAIDRVLTRAIDAGR